MIIINNIAIKRSILVEEPDSVVIRTEVLISEVSAITAKTTMSTTAKISLFL
jgi:hypothetical protein